jgi:hypothetical protein
MKNHLLFSLALLAILSAVPVVTARTTEPSSAESGRKFYMVVVAEQANPPLAPALPTPDRPAYYVAYDAGYIEAGDPIANEKPPAAAAVAQALRGTLVSQSYLPATAQSAPSLLIVYHWGLLRRDSQQIRNTFKIQPNLKARIALIATNKQAGEVESLLLDRRMVRLNPTFRSPGFIGLKESDLLDLVEDDRYFVVVSAYDFSAFSHRETKLLWRLKVSARTPGESMAEVLPALLRGGALYLGRNLPETKSIRELLPVGGPGANGTPTMEEFLPPPEVARQLDEPSLDGLKRQEHIEFSGESFFDKK